MQSVEKFSIQRFTEQERENIEATVARERPLTIILNNQELVTLLCSPAALKYLAIGFLSSEGLVENKDAIRKILVDDQKGIVRVETRDGQEFLKSRYSNGLLLRAVAEGRRFIVRLMSRTRQSLRRKWKYRLLKFLPWQRHSCVIHRCIKQPAAFTALHYVIRGASWFSRTTSADTMRLIKSLDSVC